MSVLLDMVLPSTLRPPPCQWDPADPSCCRMSSSWMRWVILTGSESPKEWYTPRAVERLGTLKLLMTSQSTARPRSLTPLERRPHAYFASQQLVSEFMTKMHWFDKINLSAINFCILRPILRLFHSLIYIPEERNTTCLLVLYRQ